MLHHDFLVILVFGINFNLIAVPEKRRTANKVILRFIRFVVCRYVIVGCYNMYVMVVPYEARYSKTPSFLISEVQSKMLKVLSYVF